MFIRSAIIVILSVCLLFSLHRVSEAEKEGYTKGYEAAKNEVVELPKATAEMCTAWFFSANLKDAKKRMCK